MPPALGTARAAVNPRAIAEKEYVGVARVCRILETNWTVVYRIISLGGLRLIDYRFHGRKRVRYQSIVDYCDRLRQEYAIADRRPPLSNPILRHKDEDLLPFPIKDTTTCKVVREALGYSTDSPVLKLLEEGKFECYRLTPGGPWRISASSFTAWYEQLRAKPGLPSWATPYREVE
jgi:hypothetical protein